MCVQVPCVYLLSAASTVIRNNNVELQNADYKTSKVTKGRITKRRITKRRILQKVEKQKVESNKTLQKPKKKVENCGTVIYMCMFIYSNSRGLFSSKQCAVIEEKAEMKGYIRLG